MSTQPTMWNLMRTHDGFAIQYGEEDGVVDLYCGHKEPASAVGASFDRWIAAMIIATQLYISKLDTCNHASRRWNFARKSDDVGGEIAETVEDQVNHLRNQVALRDAELAAKDHQLAQKERELQTLREHHQAELSKLKGDSGSVQHQALGDSFESMAILDEPKGREENNAR
ncbi:unnamed protein product [Rhizoctonia solani]|nr:unnamed protein product [Rhizoctonia solani]